MGIMVRKITLLVFTLSVQTVFAGNAEEVPSPMATQTETETPGQMEEVTVYGQKTLLNLKRAMIEAENNTFEVFNSLNTDNQYDMRCYKEAPTGSHIKHRFCYPNYVKDLEYEAASRWSAGSRINDFPDGVPLTIMSIAKEKEEKLREIWGALAAEHPEMLTAIKAHSEAKKLYTAEKEKRCKRLIIFCLKSE